jgi:hypothetical protein
MKLLPRYSLKQIFLAMVGVALVMACLASAYRGSMVGMCLIAGVVSSAIPLLCLGLVYWVTYGLRCFLRRPSIVFLISISGLSATQSEALSQSLIPVGKKGYHLTIEDNIPSTGFGFSNIRVKLEKFPLQPVKNQEVFTVVIGPQTGWANDRSIATLVIEPGESSASVDLVCPQESNQFQYLSFSLKRGADESGASSRDFYSTYIHSSKAQNSDEGVIWITSLASQQTGSRIGIPERGLATNANVSGNAEAEAVAASIFGDATFFATTTKSIGTTSLTVKEPNPIHPGNLPDAWIGLSAVTKIFITLNELKLLSKENQVKLMALDSWIAAGGTLIVFDTDQNWKEGRLTNAETGDQTQVGWKAVGQVMPILLGTARRDELEEWNDRWMQYEASNRMSSDAQKSSASPLPKDNGRHWQAVDWQNVKKSEPFLMHRYVLGRVFAVRSHFENWKLREWTTLDNAVLDSGGSQQVLFEGAAAEIDSHISIPGVGKPPLKAFQLLMCLFVLAAGPGVYSILKKSDQMQLFFFVVPVLAITSCLGLLGYVVLIEGFGSYGRTQTVTWVDHRCQSAVTQARSMYYHGLTPAPYKHDSQLIPLGNSNNANHAQRFRHVNGAVDFSSSEIAPRVPHLFVNLGSRRMDKNLRLKPKPADPAGNDSASYLMSNNLGNQVEIAVFRTEAGWFLGKKIGDQQSVEAIEISQIDAHEQLSMIVNQLCPLDDGSRWLDPRFNTEAGVVEMLRYSEMKEASQAPLDRWILPGSYVAILNDFSEVNPLLQTVEFKHRLHVVVGKW